MYQRIPFVDINILPFCAETEYIKQGCHWSTDGGGIAEQHHRMSFVTNTPQFTNNLQQYCSLTHLVIKSQIQVFMYQLSYS